MRLLRIKHVVWDVVAVLDSRDECVLSHLLTESAPGKQNKSKQERMAEQMLALLRETVPANGPPTNTPFSKRLGGNIFEFRIGYGGHNKGPKLRVTYFYGKGGKLVICAHRLWKRGEGMQPAIDAAARLRKAYLADADRGDLKIYSIPEHKEPS